MVYVRYLDHVLFRNTQEALENAAERETVGWLTQETKELLCIQHDRTVENFQYSSGTASGLVLLKKCILEIRASPLQNFSTLTLFSRNKHTKSVESALQTTERKIQPQ